MNGFLIAGTASGVGKTTVTLAILAAFRQRGLAVQPFKAGPDFLDTGHHTRIAGRAARNVDTWMLPAEANLHVVRDASRDADAFVVEGMMGLFDGKSGDSEAGSSAEIAKLLKLPVVLVLNAGKSARSLAAVVLGFEMFARDLPLAGVILNRVASDRHYQLLETAIRSACKTPILGWLPRDTRIAIPERHLGLQTAEESSEEAASSLTPFVELAETHLDLDALRELRCGLSFGDELPACIPNREGLRIGIARDAAFSFYYEDNLDLLREQGATLVPFSPLADTHLPDDLDALYLGGGYPELHAADLAANKSLLADVRAFAEAGKPIYAECGGMVYLGACLVDEKRQAYAMAGVLPLTFEMTGKLVKFGYVTVTFTRNCLLGPAGTTTRGHSFHYSKVRDQADLPTSYHLQYSLSGKDEPEGFSMKKVLASYVHLHFRATPSLAQNFVLAALQARSVSLVTA